MEPLMEPVLGSPAGLCGYQGVHLQLPLAMHYCRRHLRLVQKHSASHAFSAVPGPLHPCKQTFISVPLLAPQCAPFYNQKPEHVLLL
jgi:hypothetical protein